MWRKKIKIWIKNEVVLCIAAMLALISMCFVPPGKEYRNYLDYRTLTLLFCLMAVVEGWKKVGVFECVAGKLLSNINNTRQLAQVLVFLCFFLSMFITNDVALLTFVPFAIMVLGKADCRELAIYVIVLQTIAANLGSMLLPVGNPQNLYLYGMSGLSFFQFVCDMLPLWLVSLAGIWSATLLVKKRRIFVDVETVDVKSGWIYLILFLLCLATVANWLPYYVLFPLLAGVVFWKDKKILLQVDYALLATFICFFIFIGNIKAMPQVAELLNSLITGRELAVGILASQVISNVPAAILLSGFTDNIRQLLWATNIGGLGTLIASLASLISYKIYTKSTLQMKEHSPQNSSSTHNQNNMHKSKKGEENYCKIFTGMNLVFLALLWGVATMLSIG